MNFFKLSGHRWPYLLGNDYNGQGQLYYWIGLKQHQWAIRGILQAYLPFWPLLALQKVGVSTWPRVPLFRLPTPSVVSSIHLITLEDLIYLFKTRAKPCQGFDSEPNLALCSGLAGESDR